MSSTEAKAEIVSTEPSIPNRECDVVMKGGITSGVIYPMALSTLGSTYRFRNIGGASAGAIGAAVGAAAEFARSTRGFERLSALPAQLGEGRLAELFQPQRETRQLLPLMLIATGNDRPGRPRTTAGKVLAFTRSLCLSFPLPTALGVAPGAALMVVGVASGGVSGWLLTGAGLLLAIALWFVAVLWRLWRKSTVDVPGNLFGICRGLGRSAEHPGFTDWLSDQIDIIAGLPVDGPPLTFGQLWAGEKHTSYHAGDERQIDLRMITTNLSEGMPYEMPWDARRFFFDPAEWGSLFPERVVSALKAAPPAEPAPGGNADDLRQEEAMAMRHDPPLRRLPDAEYLPVVVATRLSLSFPLLIAAVPLWTIDRRRSAATAKAVPGDAPGTPTTATGVTFARMWFTDGGFCSNFPVHLFDAALPSRPTFAINLGRFPAHRLPDPDQRRNVEWARNNLGGLLPTIVDIPRRGIGALGGFASAALNTARNWQDSSHLDQPGYRDRIVRVLQTKAEGGLNLHMDTPTIDGLARRGQAAGEVMVEQFTQARYPVSAPVATGWDNHRWIRYRALLSVLPEWLQSYSSGRAALEIDPSSPPSYEMTGPQRLLAEQLTAKLDELANLVAKPAPKALDGLTSSPKPAGTLRRIPKV